MILVGCETAARFDKALNNRRLGFNVFRSDAESTVLTFA